MPGEPIRAAGAQIDWRRVAIFTAIAYAGPLLVALFLVSQGASMRQPNYALTYGSLAMLAPLAAGLITERMAGRRALVTRDLDAMRGFVLRTIGRIVLWSGVAFATIVAAQLLVAGLGSGVPGAGRYATPAEIAQTLISLGASGAAEVPASTLISASILQAFLAGLTINGIFAFGEEYGWRGVLAEELLPLGVVRANLLIGVIWGVWHAPLIALGHNYGDQWLIGIPLFVLITIPLSFILWWARAKAGIMAAPAVVHGAFNGFAGIFAIVLTGANVVIAVPVGLMGSLALGLVAAFLWLVLPPRPDASADAASG